MHGSDKPLYALESTPSSTTLNSNFSIDRENEDPIKLPPPAPSRFGRGHQRSRTAIDLPPLFTNTSKVSIFSSFRASDKSHSPTRSPPRSPTHEVDDLDFADEQTSDARFESRPNKLVSWFSGNSDPISIGILPSPVKEQGDPIEQADMEWRSSSDDNLTPRTAPSRPATKLQKAQPPSPTVPAVMSAASKFSFFRPKPAPVPRSQEEVANELTKLDVSSALFPAGPPDEFSPAAFKNLQMNAEGTLRKFQSAYIQALQSVRETTSERNVQKDELEAAQTRNEHLKLQLTDMAEKALEQERAMKAMAEELAAERQKRLEEEAFRKRSLKMVPTTEQDLPLDSDNSIKAKRQSRGSNAPSLIESEAESEVSSSADSVFSRPHRLSHTTSYSSPTPTTPFRGSPDITQRDLFSQDQSPMSPSKGVTLDSPGFDSKGMNTQECQICHGMPSSEAWNVVNVLKEESSALKHTIAQLEAGLESSLDYVSGLI